MVKPKKSEIGVWKTVEVKGHRKHQKEKLKHIHEELPAKPKRQKNVNDASRPKHRKHQSQRFHDRNRQWNNFPTSMPFLSHGSPILMPCGSYYSMPYSYESWYYDSYMPPLPRCLCPNYITYRNPAFSKPSPTNNDRFDQKDRSIQKKKHKVIKQVYHVKKDGRLNKNPDLTHDKEKPTVEETSVTPIDQIVPGNNLASSDIVEQETSSAGGQEQKARARSAKTGLTGLKTGMTGLSGKFAKNSKNKKKGRPSFEELLAKYEKSQKFRFDTSDRKAMLKKYRPLLLIKLFAIAILLQEI